MLQHCRLAISTVCVVTLLASIPRQVFAQSAAQERLEQLRRQQEEERERQREAQERQRQMEEERQRQAEAERQAEERRREMEEQRERQAEMQRQAEERQREMEQQRERQAEAQRQADMQRQAEAERQAQAERQASAQRQFQQQNVQHSPAQLPLAPPLLQQGPAEQPAPVAGIVASRSAVVNPQPFVVNPAPQSQAQIAANAAGIIAIQRAESLELENAFDQLKLMIAQSTSDPNLAQALLQSVGQPDLIQQALDAQLQGLAAISQTIAQRNAGGPVNSSSGGSAYSNSQFANQAGGASNPNDPNYALNVIEGAPLQGSPAASLNSGGLDSGTAGIGVGGNSSGLSLNGTASGSQNGSGPGLGGGTSSGASPAQPGCQWTQTNLTVTAWGQDYLYVNSDVMAGIVDGQGQPAFVGKYIQVSLSQYATQPAYFGLSGQLNQTLTAGQQVTLPITVPIPPDGITQQPIVVKFCRE